MIIGIDASRAFLTERTGIEEYSYQVIKHLREVIPKEYRVLLYVRKKWRTGLPIIDFSLPENWRLRGIWAPRFWTQGGLSWEMLFRPVDTLFIPAHTVPLIHPKKTFVTIHGLEYEFCPKAYSLWERLYMRVSIRFSCWAAQRVICVSGNTKKDIQKLYRVPEEKIQVIYEGFSRPTTYNLQPTTSIPKPYLLFVGRLEERKNIRRIIEAFEILKEKYHFPHKLVLAGKPGYGYEKIKYQISKSKNKEVIIELGYVSEEEKWGILKNADVFLFPTLYEGFGLPILEAQSAGVPVITSHLSSLPEVGGAGAVYVDPLQAESIVQATRKVLADPVFRDGIIEQGRLNARRFQWPVTAQAVGLLLLR